MVFALTYIAKVALVMELITDMMDLSYFGYERKRLVYNLFGSLVWIVIIQYIFSNHWFSWIVVISFFIFRTSFIISKKKKMDEQNKENKENKEK